MVFFVLEIIGRSICFVVFELVEGMGSLLLSICFMVFTITSVRCGMERLLLSMGRFL